VRIALDAMGGDHAPEAPVRAATMAMAEDEELEVVLVGDPQAIRQALPAGVRRVPQVVAASQVIGPEEPPVDALKAKPDASLPRTVELLARGEVEAAVSAGSTGALMAAATLRVGLLPSVSRPALGTLLPRLDGPGVLLLDVGAHVDARPQVLVQFAIMGSLYLEAVLGRPQPRVGLLNVGTEADKGSRVVRTAHGLLERTPHVRFVGNVEARELYGGRADVVVCDGFTGNLVLKGLEGFGLMIRDGLRQELGRSWRGRLGGLLVAPAVRRLMRSIDYEETGGAPLFGPSRVVVKCHGSSGPRGILSGLRQAKTAWRQGMTSRMARALEEALATQGLGGAAQSGREGA
jgi:glycerol-3-phosphate acyltransferase PlsX